jgi:hypothetical protein
MKVVTSTIVHYSESIVRSYGFQFPQLMDTLVNVSKLNMVVTTKHIQYILNIIQRPKYNIDKKYLRSRGDFVRNPFKEILSFSDISELTCPGGNIFG